MQNFEDTGYPGRIIVCVTGGRTPARPISRASIAIHDEEGTLRYEGKTGKDGCLIVEKIPPGRYCIDCLSFGDIDSISETVEAGCDRHICFHDPLDIVLSPKIVKDDCTLVACDRGTVGRTMHLLAEIGGISPDRIRTVRWSSSMNATLLPMEAKNLEMMFTPLEPGKHIIRLTALGYPPKGEGDGGGEEGPETTVPFELFAYGVATRGFDGRGGGSVKVSHLRSRTDATRTFALWSAIRNRTKAISFSGSGYKSFIDNVFCRDGGQPLNLASQITEVGHHPYGVRAFELLKTATEAFLLMECGISIDGRGSFQDDLLFDEQQETKIWGQDVSLNKVTQWLEQYLGTDKRLPYLERVVNAAFPGRPVNPNLFCNDVLTTRAEHPCLLELIWNYWHEEGMVVQSINAITRRFQNVRGPGDRDPLAHLELDPLRPLNNILWGFVEEERDRLSVKRRAYEYQHHYGLSLYGKAVADMRPVETRSKFLEAFHNLLHKAAEYYKAIQDTQVVPDGYPLLHALREVHLILAQGAHNQFGDLPWTARVEMLVQQWILARPEMRDFLQSRVMVPYREEWMPQVDTMKSLQGWSDTTVTHFRDLGVYGEQILLTVRWHNWNDINDEDEAKGWADYWRPEIQGYLHAYRAVTGVDLSNPDTVDSTMPSVHLRKRLAAQARPK